MTATPIADRIENARIAAVALARTACLRHPLVTEPKRTAGATPPVPAALLASATA